MTTQYQGGPQPPVGYAKPNNPGFPQGPQANSAVMPQTTPGGLSGTISNNPYQVANSGGGGGGVSGGYSGSGAPLGAGNANRTDWLTDNGRIGTGVDNFRQFGDQYYNHMMDRTAGQRQQADQSLQQSLVNRGLQPGTEAYNAEMNRLDQRNNDFMSGTAATAEQLGLAAQNQYFGQEMQNNQYDLAQNQQNWGQGSFYDQLANQRNIASIGAGATTAAAGINANSANYRADLAHALGINQLNEGARQFDIGDIRSTQGMDQQYQLGLMGQYNNFMNTGLNQFNAQQQANNAWYNQAGQMANNAPGVMFNPNNNYAGQQLQGNQNYVNAYGQDQNNLASLFAGGLSSLSDIRLKENIELVDTVDGVNVYEFDYINKPGRYRGVMAQEVIQHKPEAIRWQDGFMKVIYDLLPVNMEVVA